MKKIELIEAQAEVLKSVEVKLKLMKLLMWKEKKAMEDLLDFRGSMCDYLKVDGLLAHTSDCKVEVEGLQVFIRDSQRSEAVVIPWSEFGRRVRIFVPE